MSADAARAAYVALVAQLDPGWTHGQTRDTSAASAAAPAERKQSWVVFSSMQDSGYSSSPFLLPHSSCLLSHTYLRNLCHRRVRFSRRSCPQRPLRQQRRLLQAKPQRPLNPPSSSIIRSAAVAGRIDNVRSLLDSRTCVNTRDENQQTM